MYRQHNDNETGVNSGNLESFMIRLKNIKSGWFSQQILYLANVLRYQNKIDSLLKATTIIQRLMKLMVFLKMRRKKRCDNSVHTLCIQSFPYE